MKDDSAASFDGRAIANFVLDYCDRRKRSVSNLSLQKIVFFCHAWSLTRLGKPLIRHSFEAWQHGPVLQYLYREFKDFGEQPVTSRARRLNPLTGQKEVVAYDFDMPTDALLTEVVDFYSRMSAYDLVALTHVRGGPWEEVWHHGGSVNPGMKISDDEIARFYSKIRAPFVAQ
jgi:uncharacterized phage-associated protein